MSGLLHRSALALLAIIVAVSFDVWPAMAENLGDIPANRALGSGFTCPKLEFLGPMVTAECLDKSQLIIMSQIDVRSCVGYVLAVDGAGRVRCKVRARK